MSEAHPIQQAASPTRLAWRRLRRNRLAMAGAIVLALLYMLAIFAGFFSPYSPTDQEFRSYFFHPPTPLYFHTPSGALQLYPSVHATYLADNRQVRYAEGTPAAICFRHAAANLNPYLSETLESQDPILTIRDEMGQTLSTVTSVQETAEDSGIFCATLALDSHLLSRTQSIRAETRFGDSETFQVLDTEAPADPASAMRTLYLQNQSGQPSCCYSRLVKSVRLRFFVRSWRYRILWFFQSDLHLFGASEPAHIFLLGTDQSGRDLFSRLLFGAQISLTVGLFAVILTSFFGLVIGGIAGYYGGSIDALIMRLSEILLSIPPLYLLLTLSSTIPDRLQETYDRIRQFGLQTFAWQQSPGNFAAVTAVIVLSLSYYCLRGGWRRRRVLVSVLLAGLAVFGPRILEGFLAALQWVLPGSTHLSSDWTYLFVIVILSTVGWAGMARVIRGMVLPLREAEFVLAARALGSPDSRVILRHVLPNTFGYVIVRATMLIPLYILAEVSLSFLGLGVQEPMPSWGNMLTQAQNLRVLTQFTWTLAPGFLIFFTVLAYNILGDGLRDAVDPRQT